MLDPNSLEARHCRIEAGSFRRRQFRPVVRALALPSLCILIGLGLGNGCSDDGKKPSAPAPEPAALSGRVRLVGKLFDETNHSMGDRVIDDASGVMVRLIDAQGSAVDSVRTVDGRYEFPDVANGTYRASAVVVAPNRSVTGEVTVAGQDVSVPDTLMLAPCGELSTYPNPAHPEGIGIEFTTQTAQTYTVEVWSLVGDPVWTFSQEVPPGYYHVHWAGHDMADHHVPGGAYWVVAWVNGTESCGLVFWAGEPEDNEGHCGHIEADGLFVAHHDERLVTCWQGVCTGDLRVAAGEQTHALELWFLDAENAPFAVADSCPDNRMSWTVADTTVANLVPVAESKWEFRVVGQKTGTTDVILHAWHENHIHLSSPSIPIVVE